MSRVIPTGEQSFVTLRQKNLFYVDKTRFIQDWWHSEDRVTLITRPRRFGKTLMLDTVRAFFSLEYANRQDLFAGLAVWQDESMRPLQGTLPVISLSFASIKGENFCQTLKLFNSRLVSIYNDFRPFLDFASLSDTEQEQFASVRQSMDEATAQDALLYLTKYLARQSGRLPIILLDEYDTPLQEAWMSGYWDELVGLMQGMLNATFTSNPWLGRGLLTGITRVGKESLFSDLNNLQVVSTTSTLYTDCFGFTEEEVFAVMDEYGLAARQEVRLWYDGFIFGKTKGIYNPWSIIGYLKNQAFAPYWAQTSSNALVGQLIAKAPKTVKDECSALICGKSIVTSMDEQVVFSQLSGKKSAIWSLLMASGYVKPLSFRSETNEYELALTNHEVHIILEGLISDWFNNNYVDSGLFGQALLTDDLETMNETLREIAENTFSFFDTGGKNTENFYHAFVLGLIVNLKNVYDIYSNRESGLGRYDICMIPKNIHERGIIIEFKTMKPKKEKDLKETCANALQQIQDKKYFTILKERGVASHSIYTYGFAFHGKEVLICGGLAETIGSLAQDEHVSQM